MGDGERDAVAGLFTTRRQAAAVWQELRGAGIADADIEIGRPAPGRYRLEVRESEDLGRGALDGIVLGTPLGAVIGVLMLTIAVPQAADLGARGVVLGLLMGGFWGSFFGGLAGMVLKAVAHDGPSSWCEIPEQSTAILVAAHGGGHADAARTVMRRHGVTYRFRQAPSIVPGSVIDPSGPAPEEAMSASGAGHQISLTVPRGAFLLLVLFLLALSALWANVYLRVVWRA
jgi:hypothetical protein